MTGQDPSQVDGGNAGAVPSPVPATTEQSMAPNTKNMTKEEAYKKCFELIYAGWRPAGKVPKDNPVYFMLRSPDHETTAKFRLDSHISDGDIETITNAYAQLKASNPTAAGSSEQDMEQAEQREDASTKQSGGSTSSTDAKAKAKASIKQTSIPLDDPSAVLFQREIPDAPLQMKWLERHQWMEEHYWDLGWTVSFLVLKTMPLNNPQFAKKVAQWRDNPETFKQDMYMHLQALLDGRESAYQLDAVKQVLTEERSARLLLEKEYKRASVAAKQYEFFYNQVLSLLTPEQIYRFTNMFVINVTTNKSLAAAAGQGLSPIAGSSEPDTAGFFDQGPPADPYMTSSLGAQVPPGVPARPQPYYPQAGGYRQ